MTTRLRDIKIGLASDQILEAVFDVALPAEAATAWVWTLNVDRQRIASGTAVLTHDADAAVLSNSNRTITLTFNIPASKTGDLAAGAYEYELVVDQGASHVVPVDGGSGLVSVQLPLGTAGT